MRDVFVAGVSSESVGQAICRAFGVATKAGRDFSLESAIEAACMEQQALDTALSLLFLWKQNLLLLLPHLVHIEASLPIHQFLFALVIVVDYPITAGFNVLLGSSSVVNVGKWVTLRESANLETQKCPLQLRNLLTQLQL